MPTTEADGATSLATKRLTLRPVTSEDLPAIVALAGNVEVAEWKVSIRHPLSEAQVKAWLGGRAVPARGGDREVIVYTLTRAAFQRLARSQVVGRQ